MQLAGRDIVIRSILDGLNNGVGDPHRATIFIGARGSGKTVLLAKIAEEASANGWISVNVNAGKGMLDEILIQIRDNAEEFLSPKPLSQITSINIGGFGVTRSLDKSVHSTSWRSEITKAVKELNAKSAGLLITVDEVSIKSDELQTLIVTFQHLVRERREVALIMAGLPQKVSNLLRDDAISFLRRSFQHHLNPIEESEVRYSIKRTVELSGRTIQNEALDLAVESAKGFPFMIQLVGYQMWRQHPEEKCITLGDAAEGISLAEKDLERMIFETTYRELSEKDIAFLAAMLEDTKFSTVADISKRMGVSPKYAGIYRKRLIEQGIIGSRGHGKVAFELPMFREYIQSRLNTEG